MAIKIEFDSSHNVMPLTLVLATRSENKLGGLNYHNLVVKDSLVDCSELSFKINKNDCIQNRGKIEKSRVTAMSISNTIQSVGGYTYFGTLAVSSRDQLLGYCKSNQTENRVLTLAIANTIKRLGVSFSQDNDTTLFLKSKTDDTELIKIQQDGSVYINNTNELGLPINEVCQVKLELDILIDLSNDSLWKSITDFKLVWVKEWDRWFEIYVSIDEAESTIKNITAKSLGEAELSQVYLHNIQINTEDDIARDDYVATVLYNPNNKQGSLLHRITEKVPHYHIAGVDESIMNIQRTFTFDGKSIYDAFKEIAEEMECIFEIRCYSNPDGRIVRDIYVYSVSSYGNDTNILLSASTLANNINYSVDSGSVKNCFRLEAGDDLMTATVRNCNPNGSGYIWYISNNLKADISDELSEKLELYNELYNYYQTTYNPFNINTSELDATNAIRVQSELVNNADIINLYNNLIDKYSQYTSDYKAITTPVTGYSEIMEAYYNTIDFYYYLNNSLMPTVSMSRTNAQAEGNKLNYQSLKNTAVQNLSSSTSVATVSSAILAIAKVIVNPSYQVKIVDKETSFTYSTEQSKWKGKFVITNYSDETDTYTTMQQTVIITSDYETFIKQKLDIALSNAKTDTVADIGEIFKLSDSNFRNEMKKYSLQRLIAFHDVCQGCLDILQQQGIADDRDEGKSASTSIYNTIYLPYYNKLGYIQAEMDIRQSELEIIQGKFDENGGVLAKGMQIILRNEQNTIQENLNFQNYLGEELWGEFIPYRREDTYSNSNYISDGLDNKELFNRAMEFMQTAKDEIEKSATLQHTINATLNNLLVMKEFQPIVDYFEVGNWLRIKVDDVIYKLRLVDYQIDFDSLENIDVTFSDITVDNSGVNSVKDILNQATSMATTYSTTIRQARQGSESASVIDSWVDKGLLLTTTKISDKADNQEVTWDKHGLLCREYDLISESYTDNQLKLINKGLYVTDNNWRTAKAGIGNFTFFNPSANNGEGEWQEGYGVIADTLVGNLILGKNVGIYNTTNSITMDENGFIMTTNGTQDDTPQSVFTIRRKTISDGEMLYDNMFYIDSNGYVTINGGVKIQTGDNQDDTTLIEMVNGKITSQITSALDDEGVINSEITQAADNVEIKVASELYGTTNKKLNEARLDIQAGSIVSTVSQKLNTSDLGTQIVQNAESVRLAWNGTSKYMAFEYSNDSPSLNIYSSSLSDNADSTEKNNKRLLKLDTSGLSIYTATDGTLQMKLNNNGSWFYNNGITIGKIGTNTIGTGENSLRGLTFDLDTEASFMGWGYKESGTNSYATQLYYYPNTVEIPDAEYEHSGFFMERGFHFYDDIYIYYGKTLHLGSSTEITNGSDGLILQNQYSATRIYGNGAGVTLAGDIGLSPVSGGVVNCGSDLYMNDNVIYDTTIATSSDARLKTNITDSSVNALSLLNQIDIKEFDWIKSKEHTNVGIIAQQLQKIIPELVQTNPNNGRLSVKSDNFIPYLIKAIQELIACISNDSKCKNILKSLSVELSNNKNNWKDSLTIDEKQKFILETEYKPVKENTEISAKENERNKKIQEFLRRPI